MLLKLPVLAPILAVTLGALGLPERGAGGAAAPARLSETGLYEGGDIARVDPRNLPYTPQYPLWTDGAEKARWIFLPPGARIDSRDPDAWDFPVGTKLWKQFSFGGRKVETRMLWRDGATHWVFASYRWREDQSDADLAPEAGLRDVAEVAPGRFHSIPGRQDCLNCHGNGRVEALGFTPLQLSTDRDPLAPHAEPLRPGMATLRTLVDRGLLSDGGASLLQHPPRIQSANPRTRAALGYLSSNCGACHQPSNPIPHVTLDLKHVSAARDEASEPGYRSMVGRLGHHGLPDREPGTALLIQPGDPAHSLVLHRMATRSPSTQMPPLGSVKVDTEAVALMRKWIEEDLGRGN
ncbi:MAG TPA: hypothetical protein VJ483_02820 [Holophagaceae bacterium]|nr:hypothetical protein [Holophagaceae bacterium]